MVAITLDWEQLNDDVLDQHLLDVFDTFNEGAHHLDEFNDDPEKITVVNSRAHRSYRSPHKGTLEEHTRG